jgi:hypothetical protein
MNENYCVEVYQDKSKLRQMRYGQVFRYHGQTWVRVQFDTNVQARKGLISNLQRFTEDDVVAFCFETGMVSWLASSVENYDCWPCTVKVEVHV